MTRFVICVMAVALAAVPVLAGPGMRLFGDSLGPNWTVALDWLGFETFVESWEPLEVHAWASCLMLGEVSLADLWPDAPPELAGASVAARLTCGASFAWSQASVSINAEAAGGIYFSLPWGDLFFDVFWAPVDGTTYSVGGSLAH